MKLLSRDSDITIDDKDSVLIIREDGSTEVIVATEQLGKDEETQEDMIKIHDSAWLLLAVMNFINDDEAVMQRISEAQKQIE